MRKSFLLATVVSIAFCAVTASGAATIYNVDQTIGAGSVIGTITTDGTIGALSSTNIIAWNLDLNGVGATANINSGDSIVHETGADVTATPTAISFDFSAGDNGYLVFQSVFGNGQTYWCNASSAGACFQGKSVVPQFYLNPSSQFQPASGNLVIATAAGTVPEPASWALMLAGFGGLGFTLRRHRRTGLLAA